MRMNFAAFRMFGLAVVGASVIAAFTGEPTAAAAPSGRGALPVDDAQTAETRAIAADFVDMFFNRHQMAAAVAKYVAPDLIQHNPDIENGSDGDRKFLEARRARDPAHYLPVEQWHHVMDHILVHHDIFVLHAHVFTNPHDKGREFIDIFRVAEGKIVEHWDVIQAVPAEAKNNNTMWCDPCRRTHANAEPVVMAYVHLLEQHKLREAVEKYVSPHFVQHSPHIPDGREALIIYHEAKDTPERRASAVSTTFHIVPDGDLVLMHRHVTEHLGDRGRVYADLFRVEGGKIVEHWDVIQAVPPTTVSGNTMY